MAHPTPGQMLRESIKEYLLPALEAEGFARIPPADKTDRYHYPFGHHRRTTENGLEIMEIQLHKHNRAAFRINFATAPAEGIVGVTGQRIAQQDVLYSSWLDTYYELCPRPSFPARWWFSIRRWPWQKKPVAQADYDALIQQVVRMIPDINQALREGKCGAHVRCIDKG